MRRFAGRNGLDYLEVGPDQQTLHVYLLGKLPEALAQDSADLPRHFRIDGGDVISGIKVLDVDPVVDSDPEVDDVLVLRLDRRGDFSTYTLRLVDVDDVDPHYASLDFSFKVDCPSDVDCRPDCDCPPASLDEPRLNYLAKDYASFRQLLFDRMALLVPDWTERHVPDVGVTLVELLAYVGDYLSYHQDAVATEAYLGTARQRISVRRHARLVDYRVHEGCNARAWVHVGVSTDPPPLPDDKVAFVTGLDPSLGPAEKPIAEATLAGVAPSAFSWFEPAEPLRLREAHNRIEIYRWGQRECCLEIGSTRATLVDAWTGDDDGRALDLEVGDALLFEEVKGARTGVDADFDPSKRWVVRLTRVERTEDPLYLHSDGEVERPTALVDVEWSAADALPFALCLSAIGEAPDCPVLDGVTVARGNIVLVDHGRTVGEPLPPVPERIDSACCECAGQPAEIARRAGHYRPRLAGVPLVHRVEPDTGPASKALVQDPRCALPAVVLEGEDGSAWWPAPDLVGAGGDDRQFVAEIDNDQVTWLRFGDGWLGREPDPGVALAARYRVGGGRDGNVGAEAICRIVLDDKLKVGGVDFTVRNPIAAAGGTDPEPLAQAKLHAPGAFRRRQRRAITADDYAEAARHHPDLQRAAARLVWTGGWWEAVVAIDPLGRESADPALVAELERRLEAYRRIGHDLRVCAAAYVPIELKVEICALPEHDRGQVRKAVEKKLVGADGWFQPDRLSFGGGVFVSRIVAEVVAVPGVECATVTVLNRRFQHPNGELEAGVLPLEAHEIAQLANDPNHPERGQLELVVGGGR
ncbi:MAG TPA: putative baseplate assembly protein [Sphingomicrobium sp.]|nr:putative baseplate assembly protein [Sphingomicrobium sp.]